MAFKLIPYPDNKALAKAVATDWLERLAVTQGKNASSLPYAVALSGGRIARDFYAEIVEQSRGNPKYRSDSVFWNVHFFWADERCVPPTDAESNYRVARELLFEPLKIPESQIHRIRGEEEEPLALRDAVENICFV